MTTTALSLLVSPQTLRTRASSVRKAPENTNTALSEPSDTTSTLLPELNYSKWMFSQLGFVYTLQPTPAQKCINRV